MITKKKLCVVGAIVLFVNVLVIAGILHFTNEKLKKEYSQTDTLEPVNEDVVVYDHTDLTEETMTREGISEIDLSVLRSAEPAVSYNSVYTSLLIGEYVAEDGTVFRFADDYSYSGYFNEDVPEAEYYSYEIINENEAENSLVIYSPDKRSEVTYSLDLDMDGNIILNIPDTETKYVLCYDGMLYKGDKPKDADEDEAEVSEETSEETDKETEEEENTENKS